ncbi:hypothetical protein [Actinomadura rudentiformis]|uniref:Uncharacterized protein n=1 Tax=Actinomadura rudentiformis TaxID=359158 RepID=A0A6H9YXD5_9ACTN|nr:hypothetical protein [Actinomadura rudentiformis]KAB2347254.1 hypothetical protein F8566_19720 [Actinomadura rudentiformis]
MLPRPRGRRPGRYTVEFDAPDSDGEFIATSLAIATLMGGLADAVDDYTDELTRRGMPPGIVLQFEHLADNLTDAEHAARTAATNFADYFEDARTIAARGIRIIGTPRRRAA